MATLATSGLALEGIFKTMFNEETDEEIVKDCRIITRNIEVLGMGFSHCNKRSHKT